MPTSFIKDGIKFSVGDSILVHSEEELPYVARILNVSGPGSNHTHRVRVSWFYRPEDSSIPGGRKSFHGERELYSSDHIDEISSATVIAKIKVHTIEEYNALEEVTPQDFYSRFTFKVLTKEFLPPTVAVHCVCRMPENPDLHMVQCDRCTEWFHPECLGYTLEAAARMSPFYCVNCQQDLTGASAGSTQTAWM